MKNILLLAHDDAGQESRLQAALDLARALRAHLNCVDVAQLPVLIGDYFMASGEAMLIDEERARESRNRAATEARLAREDVSWGWTDITGDITDCVTGASHLADMIVLNSRLDSALAPDMKAIAGAIVTRARTPVLAVGEHARGFDAAGRALIAWDGSAPAAATLRACVPLLQLASDVCLLTVGTGESPSAEAAATYLSRHGIVSEVKRVPAGGDSVQKAILDVCGVWGASYCLMGAYSRSRVAEAIFGGVTRGMLDHASLPLVLGH